MLSATSRVVRLHPDGQVAAGFVPVTKPSTSTSTWVGAPRLRTAIEPSAPSGVITRFGTSMPPAKLTLDVSGATDPPANTVTSRPPRSA